MPSFATVALVATVLLVLVMLIAAWVSNSDRKRRDGSAGIVPSVDAGAAQKGDGRRSDANDGWSGDGGDGGGGGGD
jgi:hypothetical protein